jgi:translation initiation factor IF-2
MSETKQLRLGQIARKLNVGRNTIISFLHEKGYEVDSNPNTKISHDLFKILENAFEDSAVEKKVASNIKIGLEEKANFIKDSIKEEKKVDEKKVDEKKVEEKK